jgi:TonB family protein
MANDMLTNRLLANTQPSTLFSIALHTLAVLSIVLLASHPFIPAIKPLPPTAPEPIFVPRPSIVPAPQPAPLRNQPSPKDEEPANVQQPAPEVHTENFDQPGTPQSAQADEPGAPVVGKWDNLQNAVGSSQPGTVGQAGFDGLGTKGSGKSAGGDGPASDSPAGLLTDPKPAYTDEARRLHITGVVVLDVVLTAAGTVQVLDVRSGLGHGLDEAAIIAVNGARCRPATHKGRPISIPGIVRVNFQLT